MKSGRSALGLASVVIFAAINPFPVAAAVVDSYDEIFSLSIPDSWRATPRAEFKQNVPEIAVEPVGAQSIGLPGLIIAYPEKDMGGDLKEIAVRELDFIRAKRLTHDRPSPAIDVVKLGERLPSAYHYVTGDRPDDYSFFLFTFQGKDFEAKCPNVYAIECKKVLASIAPSQGKYRRKIYPKMGGFSVEVPYAWSVFRDKPQFFYMIRLPGDSLEIRKPVMNIKKIKTQILLEKTLQHGMRSAYDKLVSGPSPMETVAVRGSGSVENVGRFSYITGADSVRGNILTGYMASNDAVFLVVAESKKSSPLRFVLPVLSSWENR